jgi:hypothetical protein
MKYYSDGLWLVRIITNEFIIEENAWYGTLTIWKKYNFLLLFKRNKQLLKTKSYEAKRLLFPFSIFNENNFALLSNNDLNVKIKKLIKLKVFW